MTPHYTGNGYRGVYDWNYRYQYLPKRPQDKTVEGQLYELAVLTGNSYAIRRELFFYLGGYDEGFLIWNAENYEISVKLWLCSEGIRVVPCSRVMHLSKMFTAHRTSKDSIDFSARNLKRLTEVWMDEYKEYFYRNDQSRYDAVDIGDLTAQFELKERLKCKPYKHFVEVVAPDMLIRYPLVPQHFAAGTIKSESTGKCLGRVKNLMSIIDCTQTLATDFILSLEKSLKYNDTNDQCLNCNDMTFCNCWHQFGDQYWKFDFKSRQIINPPTNQCITANLTVVNVQPCNETALDQKWTWSYENKTALMNWENSGILVE